MALPVQSYTWPRVQYAVSAWVASVTGLPANQPDPLVDPPARVVWSTYDIAEVPKPFVSLQRLTREQLGFPTHALAERAVQQTLTVTQIVVGERVGVWLVWSEVSVLVQPGDTVTDTRDSLLAALLAGVDETREPLEFAASGADAITITPRGSWVVDCRALIGCTIVDDAVETVRVSSVTRRFRTRLQLYGFDGDGDESIDEYADALLASLHDPHEGGGLPFLQSYGVGVEGIPENAADISAISGALQERRLFFDVSFVAKSITYRRDPSTLDAVDLPVIEGVFG